MLTEPVAVTLRVTSILEKLGILYVIGGSIASIAYGRIRTTLDVDIVADLKAHHAVPLVNETQSEFYVDEKAVLDAIEQRAGFNMIHLETMFKADIFVPTDRPFDRQQLLRRERKIIGTEPEQTAYIASAEDVVLAKLDWYRKGGEVSERQWQDILDILEISGDKIDQDYLEKWGTALNVSELLERAFRQSDS